MEGFVDVNPSSWGINPAINPTLEQANTALYVGKQPNDRYLSYLKFDMTGLPRTVDYASLWLFAFPAGGSYTSSPYAVCQNLSAWSSSGVWTSIPSIGTCYGWYAAPSGSQWSTSWVEYPGYMNWYNQWQSDPSSNYGVMLYSQDTDYVLDLFVNSRYANYAYDPNADTLRPAFSLTFTQPAGMPDFKMPLPGVLGPLKLTWLVTNEVGGYECMGSTPWPDTAHQDNNYFSIDISWRNKDGNGVASQYGQYNTPVLAAASGKVIDVGGGNNVGDFNGFYIVIDHDGDGNINTGFSTRYLHLKQSAARANGALLAKGDSVNQGDQIGIVGTTGKDANGVSTSTAEHLHFGVRYQNQGYSYIPELSKVIMEGMLLKSYQTECEVDANGVPTKRIRYYNSTNTPTGY